MQGFCHEGRARQSKNWRLRLRRGHAPTTGRSNKHHEQGTMAHFSSRINRSGQEIILT
jgi:hypothetical protein